METSPPLPILAGEPLPPQTPRAFPLPAEILCLVIAQIYPLSQDVAESYVNHDALDQRNDGLASLALVSKTFQEAVYSELYGHLSLSWLAGSVNRLSASFAGNPLLLPLVRQLHAIHLDFEEWVQGHADRPGYGYNNEPYEQFLAVEELKFVEAGHAASFKEDNDGVCDILDLLDAAPNLHTLGLQGFPPEVDPPHLLRGVRHRGPFRLTTLDAAEYFPVTLPPSNSRIITFIVNHSPGLQLLTASMSSDLGLPGSADGDGDGPANPLLPPLTKLSLTRYDSGDPQILLGDALRILQPSLRSFSLSVSGDNWAVPLIPILPTLHSLRLYMCSHNTSLLQAELDAITPALSAATSLRHLTLMFEHPTLDAYEGVLATLSSSLRSLELENRELDSRVKFADYLEQTLVAIQRSPPRTSLRVRVFVEEEEQREELRSFVDDYERAGIVLDML